ncbi:hypothetical protein CYMTET_14141 [Cymbomonas tetramitiformis]|uniref:Uncharacterized protein n=1 Tax=Cymbomonas tetramitiformis TaxID=36881 RepID=A0AAE0LAB3_9CHLO|nr:hypothetical protein CYMTET_14141 [Cymbomonas tetramitiformis]
MLRDLLEEDTEETGDKDAPSPFQGQGGRGGEGEGEGAAVKHLDEDVKDGLSPEGWVALTVLEAHWTVLDPDLLTHATAAMQAIATETTERLGGVASVSDADVADKLHNGARGLS